MKILIVDDDLNKISAVIKILAELEIPMQINSVEDIKSAMAQFQEVQYDLAIVDIFLPVKKGSVIQKDGGGQLLNELYRKRDSHSIPKYIIGLSQMHPIEKQDFSEIWNILQYAPSSTKWSNSLKQLIRHIERVNFQNKNKFKLEKFIPTLFVEGMTDKFYLEKAFQLFAPEQLSKILIKSQSNAGANWVAAQLIIWGFQLPKDDDGNLIKGIALLDSDEAGNEAKIKINRILNSSQQEKACKNLQLSGNYSKDVLDYYKAGCQIEMEIESLFSLELLKEADSLGYLDNRNPTFIKKPSGWDEFKESAADYITSKEISQDALVLVKKVKMQKKKKFLQLVESKLEEGNLKEIFANFENLVNDIISSFK